MQDRDARSVAGMPGMNLEPPPTGSTVDDPAPPTAAPGSSDDDAVARCRGRGWAVLGETGGGLPAGNAPAAACAAAGCVRGEAPAGELATDAVGDCGDANGEPGVPVEYALVL